MSYFNVLHKIFSKIFSKKFSRKNNKITKSYFAIDLKRHLFEKEEYLRKFLKNITLKSDAREMELKRIKLYQLLQET